MKKLHVSALLLLFLLAFPLLGAVAQSGTKVIALSDRYQIRVPNSWDTEQRDDGGVDMYAPSGWGVFVYAPDALSDNIDISEDDDAVTVLQAGYPLYFAGRAPAARSIEATSFDGREAAVYTDQVELDGTNYDYELYAIQLSDKTYAMAMLLGEIGIFRSVRDQADTILTSFDVDPVILRQELADARGLNPCFVSVDAADTARLRVGPGVNRTAVAFLPVGDTFDVTGRFVTDDGSVWYQLDKDQAAPQSAAAEIWVAATEVDSTGDCDVIGEAAAPPIVPIIPNSNPPANTGDAGGQTPAQPGNVAGLVPLSGFYQFTFLSANVDASCEGTGNVQIPVAELYSGNTANQLTVLDSGARINFGGDIWTRAADGSAFYSGSVAFAATSEIPNGVVYLNVISQTELRGTMVSNFTIDGVACSDTVAISVRRQ